MSSYLSKKIKIVSFILSLFILIMHSKTWEEFGITPSSGGRSDVFVYYFQKVFTDGITQIAVPMFFIISGFLFFYNIPVEKSGNRTEWFLRQYHKRFFSLGIPFIIWNLIYYLVYLAPKYIPALRGAIRLYIRNPTIIDFLESIFWFKHNSHFWFVGYLIIMVLISPLIFQIMKSKIFGLIFLISLLNVYIFFYNIHENLIRAFLFFGFGTFMALHKKYFEPKLKSKSKTFIFLLIGLLVLFGGGFLILKDAYIGRICILIGTLLGWYSYDFFEEKTEVYWFMDYNMTIYAAHGIVINFLEKSLMMLLEWTPMTSMFAFIFDVVASFFIIVSVCYFCKQRCPMLLDLVNGKRKSFISTYN